MKANYFQRVVYQCLTETCPVLTYFTRVGSNCPGCHHEGGLLVDQRQTQPPAQRPYV
jgi:hypothetical protein